MSVRDLGWILLLGLAGCQERWFPLGIEAMDPSADGGPEAVLLVDMGGLTACRAFQEGQVSAVDRDGVTTWSLSPADDPLWGPHSASRSPDGGALLVSDTCNDRVQVYSYPSKALLWSSERDCPELDIRYPNAARFMGEGLDGTLLLTLLGQHVVIEVDPLACGNGVEGDEIVWRYGRWGTPRDDLYPEQEDYLAYPHNAHRIPETGHILVADSGSPTFGRSRVLEIAPSPDQGGAIVWSYHWDSRCERGGAAADCPGLSWTRDVELLCDDAACQDATVLVTGVDETGILRRSLSEWTPTSAHPIAGRMAHPAGLAYEADWIPTWEGLDNGGEGWLLISHHGVSADGSWVRLVAADAADSTAPEWELGAAGLR